MAPFLAVLCCLSLQVSSGLSGEQCPLGEGNFGCNADAEVLVQKRLQESKKHSAFGVSEEGDQAECKRWCARHTAIWEAKCTWGGCSACSECLPPTPAPTSSAGSLVSGEYVIAPELERPLTFYVEVPEGDGPFPVIIGLHGGGGTGDTQIKGMTRGMYASIKDRYILVAPDGEGLGWAIAGERSTRDDVTLLGTTLVDHLATFSNVKPEFTFQGNSNGAAMTNRILIENDDPRIVAGVTCVSQLNTRQWNGGNFYIGGTDDSYTTPKSSLLPRRVLQITGEVDHLIPAHGGEAGIPGCRDPCTDKLHMNPWDESAWRYAEEFGCEDCQKIETGDAIDTDDGAAYRIKYDTQAGSVEAINMLTKGHNACLKQAVIPFVTGEPSPFD